ncbi:NUDIX hydrolase [Actinacidiphila oryziradicis]|uniref:NUDIX hydrolase n=1 Tax=Actinacidiphila oryziradicis TaxID=2571141 RepID=A0A4U0S215_9ACTN|nr:NUDIX hydrolase [Actinacidiphila oryziradicis]TKA02178.1 NUDIX hydrolase [Actinacidiphila oryziradicis]
MCNHAHHHRVQAERRSIALDQDELAFLASAFTSSEEHQAEDLAMLLLRGPRASPPGRREAPPAPNALFGVGIVVHDRTTDTVLVGRSARFDNLYELAGGKREPGEDLRTTVARELAEETGLTTDPQTVRLVALLVDDRSGLPRTTIAAATRGAVRHPDRGHPQPGRAVPGGTGARGGGQQGSLFG